MYTDNVRMNITLPKDLAASLNEMAGPRKRSRFIVQALRMMIDQVKKTEMDLQLTEGYRAGKNENLKIAVTIQPQIHTDERSYV